MPLSYSILSLFLLLGALGVGYVAFVEHGPDQDRPAKEAVLDGTADEQAQDRIDADQTSRLTGSADRRMDDFGSGPGGTVVTVPLKERHRQAFTGKTVGAGGGPERSPKKEPQATARRETDAGRAVSATQSDPPSSEPTESRTLAVLSEQQPAMRMIKAGRLHRIFGSSRERTRRLAKLRPSRPVSMSSGSIRLAMLCSPGGQRRWPRSISWSAMR